MNKNSIKVGSWNIWWYGKRDFKGMAKFIRKQGIDIIGLQEVGTYQDGKREHMAKAIAKELGFYYSYFASMKTIGNAIISKYPIIDWKGYMLNPKWVKHEGTYMTEPRTAVHAKIDVGGKKIDFITAHLQYSQRFKPNKIKNAEVKYLLDVVKKLKKNVVLTGDFNLTPQSAGIKQLGKKLNRIGGNAPTWTIYPFEAYGWRENRLKYRLDNIFLSKDLGYKNFKILKSRISDHLPISAEVVLS